MAAVELSFRIDGDESAGTPLLLSNSLGTTPAMWDGLVSSLARERPVIRYDHRGHGSSPVPPGPYTVAELAEDVVDLLDRLGLERVSFAGISMGGMVGMQLATRRPERIERLIVLCSSAHMPPAANWDERAAAVRDAGTVEAVADAVIDRWLTADFARRRPEIRAELREMIANTPAEGYAACCEALRDLDLRSALTGIEAPTLVVGAAEDPATPPDEHAAPIAAAITDGELVVVQDAAHLVAVEQPERVSELILGHLDGHGVPPAAR